MIRRDLFLTMFGIGAGQFILLLATPLLARIYGPEAFGTYSVIVAVAGIVATVAALRIDLALSGATDDDIAALARAGLALPFLIVPIAISVLAVALQLGLARWAPFTQRDLPIIGLIALFQGLALAGSGLSTRLGAFRTLAAMKIAQPLVFAGLALLLFRNLELAMAFGWMAALVAAALSIRHVPLHRGWSDTASAFARAWRFPAISAPMAILDVVALSLPILFIAAAFGERAVGNYSQVQRLLGAPLVLVAAAGGQVFLKYAGDQIRAGMPVMPLLRRLVLSMGGLVLLIVIAVALLGHTLLHLLIGPEWRTDTPFLLLALLPVLWRVIASPVSPILILTNRIATAGMWQISYFTMTAVTAFSASRFLGLEGTLIALAASDFLMYGAYLVLSVKAARAVDVRDPSASPLRSLD